MNLVIMKKKLYYIQKNINYKLYNFFAFTFPS